VKCKRLIVLLVSCVLVLGLSVPVFAGIVFDCDDELKIEINALRGGSPSVTSGATKDITAKARIQKGSGEADAMVNDTTLTITALRGDSVLDTQVSDKLLTLVVGKGGQGDKLRMFEVEPLACAAGETIDFVAHFKGTSEATGAPCEKTSDRLPKTCK
jgi:hypothetical protein